MRARTFLCVCVSIGMALCEIWATVCQRLCIFHAIIARALRTNNALVVLIPVLEMTCVGRSTRPHHRRQLNDAVSVHRGTQTCESSVVAGISVTDREQPRRQNASEHSDHAVKGRRVCYFIASKANPSRRTVRHLYECGVPNARRRLPRRDARYIGIREISPC